MGLCDATEYGVSLCDAWFGDRVGLWTGPLEPHLRPEIPFVPHLTVARTDRRVAARSLADSLTGREFTIAGRLQRFAAIEVQDTGIRQISELALDQAPKRGR